MRKSKEERKVMMRRMKKHKKVLVTVKPKEYLRQGMRYCGGYTIKAIMDAYGLDDGRAPKEYLPSLEKSLGFTTPRIMQQVLHKHGFDAPVRRVHGLIDGKKLEAIKKELDKDRPVIMLVGNGYSHSGKFSRIRRNWISHWISVWGYDKKEKFFFVYDSYADPKRYDKIPVGNVKRTYEQVLRDWRGAWYARSRNFLFMPVKKKERKKGNSQFRKHYK